MNTAWISAFSAVMGSMVGGFTSFLTTYANQRAQYRRDFLSRQLAQRENLYSEFINEAARLQIDSLEQKMVRPGTMVNIYALGKSDPAERLPGGRSGSGKWSPGDHSFSTLRKNAEIDTAGAHGRSQWEAVTTLRFSVH